MSAHRPFRFASGIGARAAAVVGRGEDRLRRIARACRDRGLVGAAQAFGAHPRLPPAAPQCAEAFVVLPAVGWTYRFQRPQQLARALAAAGRPIVYLDPFARARFGPRRAPRRRSASFLHVRLRLAGRPDPYRSVLEAHEVGDLADWLLGGLAVPPAAILVELPFWRELGLRLRELSGAPLIYDCLDLHAGFADIPPTVAIAEERLLGEADLVLATSDALAARAQLRAARVAIVRNGVALADFSPAPPASLPRRRVGFVGALAAWIDGDAIAAAARARPNLSFVLAGRLEDPRLAPLARLANVELEGEIAYRDVPAFLARHDAVLVPFRNTPLTRAVDPVKLYEALAVGLPVVARRLPETARWAPLVALYDTPDELVAALDRELADDSESRRAERRAAVADASWSTRAAEVERLVAGLVRSGTK